MKKFAHIVAAAGFILAGVLPLHAGPLFDVQNGTWVVTEEVNGQPGRGMAMDVQDGILVVQVYNYEKSGQPTFHLTSGAIVEGKFTGTLMKYRGGRYFGSGPLEAVPDGSAGDVEIQFSTATSGTIQLPGEPPVPISRFKFDQIAPGQLTAHGRNELWYVAELDRSNGNKPINAWLLAPESYEGGSGITVGSPLKGSVDFSPCTVHAIYPHTLTCDVKLGSVAGTNDAAPAYIRNATQVTIEINKQFEGMTGNIKYSYTPPISPIRPETHTNRLVGMRMMTTHLGRVQQNVWTPRGFYRDKPYHYAPDPGTWVVSQELNGKPGRGMAIDVQDNVLVMQVYDYERSGAPTFHLGVGFFSEGKAAVRLTRYEGGRYFGGPPLVGVEVADLGEVKLSFDSPTTGQVQFPGESPVTIQRFEFGWDTSRPEILLGQWVFWERSAEKFTAIDLTSVKGNAAVGTVIGTNKTVQCRFEKTDQGTVRCTDPVVISPSPQEYYTFDYRFAPVNGRALGGSMNIANRQPVEGAYGDLFVLHAKNRWGTLGGSVINQLFIND